MPKELIILAKSLSAGGAALLHNTQEIEVIG